MFYQPCYQLLAIQLDNFGKTQAITTILFIISKQSLSAYQQGGRNPVKLQLIEHATVNVVEISGTRHLQGICLRVERKNKQYNWYY